MSRFLAGPFSVRVGAVWDVVEMSGAWQSKTPRPSLVSFKSVQQNFPSHFEAIA